VFEDAIVPLWLAYSPDFVFWDVGADAHMLDPLADLMLTNDTYNRMSKTVRQLVELSDGKLAVVGGGGYNPVSTAKIWTMVLADIAQVPLPSTLPAEWIRLCQDFDLEIKRGGWTDRPFRTEEETFVNIHRAVTDSISKVQDLLFPIHGIEK
jgi:acetoin utilization deacetylase AcuC-like enzyme